WGQPQAARACFGKIVRALRREFARRLPRPRLRPSQPAGLRRRACARLLLRRAPLSDFGPPAAFRKNVSIRGGLGSPSRGARAEPPLKKILRPCLMKKRAASSSVKTFTRAARRAGKF